VSISDKRVDLGENVFQFPDPTNPEIDSDEFALDIAAGDLRLGSLDVVKRTSIDRSSVADIKRSQDVFNNNLVQFLSDPINVTALAEVLGMDETGYVSEADLNDIVDFLITVREQNGVDNG